MLKQEYAKLILRCMRALEYVYYDHLDYRPDDAFEKTLQDCGLTKKQYEAIVKDSYKK